MATFQVRAAQVDQAQGLFVLVGDCLEGTIHSGMLVVIPLNGSMSITAPIESIAAGIAECRQVTRLLIRADQEERDFWLSLDLAGEALQIKSGEAGSG